MSEMRRDAGPAVPRRLWGAIALILITAAAGCDSGGDADEATSDTGSTETTAAAATTVAPVDDPFVAMCTGLYDAWAGGDEAAAAAFASTDVIDRLFAVEVKPPAGAAVAVKEPDCIYDAVDVFVDVIAEQEGSALAAVGIEVVPADEADEDFLARFEAAR